MKVAATGFQATGVDVRVAEAWVERFADVMARGGVKVTTQRDVQQLLGLERQKQLLGCAEDSSSCLAELAGALGVDAVLSGSVAKSGSGFLVTLKVLRVSDASVWASASDRLRDEDALQDFLDETARRFAATLSGATSPRPALIRWLPAIGGLVAGAAGATFFVLSKQDAATLGSGASTPGVAITGVAARGRTFEALGLTLIGVGVAGIGASVVWLLLERPTPAVTVVPVAGGAVFAFGGSFP